MPDLRLFFLGPPRIEYGGTPVKISRRKALALLAYLAVTQTQHQRETLATLLWPDTEPVRAYAYLRNALWILNRTAVAEWLEIDHEMVALKRTTSLWVDVNHFRSQLAACQSHDHPPSQICTLCLPLLTEAVDCYQGDFLAGFSLNDSLPFEEWQFFETTALCQALAGALQKLVQWYEGQNAFDQALPYAHRWLALDPLNEPAQRYLMRLTARSGQPAAALRQYQAFTEILRQEMGLAPGNETVDLYDRIRTGELAAEPQPQSPLNNLPVPLTPFVGRETELTEIHQRLQNPDCRLLTITGLGGSGKTRLALQAASECVPLFRDNCFFIPLAPVTASKFIIPTIVDTLHIPLAHSSQEPLHQLIDYLREKQMLLLLDNVEHLLESTELWQTILHNAPQVKLLLTSRERLNVQGEWVLEIKGLPFPTEETNPGAAETFSAVQLFLQNAQRAGRKTPLTLAETTAAARICQLVEGIPLGIELAAAWVKLLSCQEIAAEIQDNLDFLTTPLRNVPKRHRSLRAVFEGSWAMLSQEEQVCFRRLGVFHSGFTRQAAQEITGASLATLSSLIDKSLLQRTPDDRYEILEILRQYAQEKLRAEPLESAEIHNRHCEYYLALLQHSETPLKGHGQKAALAELGRERENIRAAWHRAISVDKVAEIHQAALSLFLFYDIQSRFQEGAEMFRQAAASLRAPGTDLTQAQQTLLGLLLATQAWFLHFSFPEKSVQLYRDSLQYLEPLGPQKETAFATFLASTSDLWTTLAEKKRRLLQSLTIYQEQEDRWGMAVTLEMLSSALYLDDPAAAEQYANQSLELRRQIGDRWGIALALFMLARIAETQGQLQTAIQYDMESLALRQELGEDLYGIMMCLDGLARAARALGNYQEAQRRYQQSLTISQEIGNRLSLADTWYHLGAIAWDMGKPVEARTLFSQALELYQELEAGSQATIVQTKIRELSL